MEGPLIFLALTLGGLVVFSIYVIKKYPNKKDK